MVRAGSEDERGSVLYRASEEVGRGTRWGLISMEIEVGAEVRPRSESESGWVGSRITAAHAAVST